MAKNQGATQQPKTPAAPAQPATDATTQPATEQPNTPPATPAAEVPPTTAAAPPPAAAPPVQPVQPKAAPKAAPAPAAKAPAAVIKYPGKSGGDINGVPADQVALMLRACEVFGVNPDEAQRPKELASWNYYGADLDNDVPAKVVIVTAGGRKLTWFADEEYPMDQDTEQQLRNLFGAWVTDPITKTVVPTRLPGDLTLPSEAVTGKITTKSHVHPGGYLKRNAKKD